MKILHLHRKVFHAPHDLLWARGRFIDLQILNQIINPPVLLNAVNIRTIKALYPYHR